jgi:hypothetical protein
VDGGGEFAAKALAGAGSFAATGGLAGFAGADGGGGGAGVCTTRGGAGGGGGTKTTFLTSGIGGIGADIQSSPKTTLAAATSRTPQ